MTEQAEISPAEWLDRPVRITSDAVYFGEAKLPGLIAEGGVTVRPGMSDGVNILTVDFLVGAVHAEDPVHTTEITAQAVTVTQYSSKDPNRSLIQDVPETSSTERMHELSVECWCDPTIDGEYLRHRKVQP